MGYKVERVHLLAAIVRHLIPLGNCSILRGRHVVEEFHKNISPTLKFWKSSKYCIDCTMSSARDCQRTTYFINSVLCKRCSTISWPIFSIMSWITTSIACFTSLSQRECSLRRHTPLLHQG